MLGRLALLAAGLVLFLPGAPAAAATPTPQQKVTCLGAQNLRQLGRDADAQALYLQLAKANVSCPGEKAALHPSWPRRVTQFVSAWWSFALYAALVGGMVFAFFTRFRPVRGALRRVPIVGFFFQPKVAVGTFDSSATGTLAFGQAFTALVNDALRRFAGESLSRVNHIAVSTGAESASATVAKLGDLGQQFKAAAAVMAFLGRAISTPVYQLAGTLQPDGGQGLGVALALDRRARAVDATTLWVKPKPPKNKEDEVENIAALQQLAALAAAWIDYAMRKNELPNEFEYSTSPKSYAFFRLGVLDGLSGRDEHAGAAYRRALHEDDANIGARLNLAQLMRRRPEADTSEAVGELKRAKRQLTQVPDRTFTFIWYQVLYNRIALRLNLEAEGRNLWHRGKDDRQRFLCDSMSMVRKLGYVGIRNWPRYPRLPVRFPFPSLVAHYGWLRALPRWRRPPARGFARFLFENAEPNAILFYLWEIQPSAGVREKITMPSWRRKQLARDLDTIDVTAGSKDYGLARGIIERFVVRRKPLSYRSKYNLACYMASRTPAELAGARRFLKEALEDAPPFETLGLAERATTDKQLASLGVELARLLAPFRGPIPLAKKS